MTLAADAARVEGPADSFAPSRWFAAALGTGIALRLLDYLRVTSFNIDEARIALNLGMRSSLQLFPPLDHNQSAPILFLWAEKLAAGLFGLNELGLRSVPLLAGIAAVGLMIPVASRLLDRRAAVLAVTLAACAPGLVQYSATLKQYAIETLATVVLLHLFLNWRDAPGSPRARIALAAGGGLAVWASAPALFVLAGVWLALLLTHSKGRARWGYPALVALLWATSFALAYASVYRPAALDPYMRRFWEPAFLHLDNAASLRNATISVRSLVWGAQMETLPFIPRQPGLWLAFHVLAVALAALAFAGIGRVASRQGRTAGVLVGAPLVAVGLAAVLALYPIVRRTMLFAMPLLLLAIASGLADLNQRLPRRFRRLGWLVTGLCVVGPNLAVAALQSLNYNQAYPVRSLVEDLRRRRAPGEPLYVSAGAIPAWTYYSTDWSAPDSARVTLLNRLSSPAGPAFENAPSRRGSVPVREGRALHYTTAAGEELLGLPSGIESGALVGPLGDVMPDTGWAAHEAERIRAAARPGVWVLMSHQRDIEMTLLRDALERRGGRATFLEDPNGTLLARLEFTGAAGGGPPRR